MRQDLAETYAARRMLPTIAKLLRSGAKAADGGLLTEAPPNTGAGWYSLSTGAWPGVHGSTNNTFHINGAPFGNRTAHLIPACCKPNRWLKPLSAAARRSHRSNGPAGAMARSMGRPSIFTPSSRAEGSPLITSAQRMTLTSWLHSASNSITPPVLPVNPHSLALPHGCQRLDQCAELIQSGERNALARHRFWRRQVRLQRLPI